MKPNRRQLFFLLPPLLTALLLYLPDRRLDDLRFGWQGVVVSDRQGRELYCVPSENGAYQQRVSRHEIPEQVKEIFVRLEDKRFYRHAGVDLLAGARAAADNIRRGRTVSGASTVTMQLARIIAPHRSGYAGKVAEVLRALWLESRLDKDAILLLYLNNLPFGYNTRGVGAAARRYFSTSLSELSRAQILLLAVIPKAPSLYDPFGSPENQAKLRARALSLAALVDLDAEEIETAMGSFSKGEPEIKAPHFVRFLLQRLSGPKGVPDLSRTEIARIVSTLDLDLYRRLKASIDDRLAAVASDERQRLALQNAAALVLDNSRGEVLAWVGSRDFFDPSAAGQIDGVRIRSSSGSTLKPFLYALALERGFTASSLLPDLALTFGLEEGYRPENFDRRRRGPVRLRTALASSLNVPAVYLLSRLGMEEFLGICDELEISLPRDAEARYGLGLAIGNAEVSLLELTRAFSVFPNHGLLRGIRSVLQVDTLDGATIALEEAAKPKRVFREQTAWLVSDILSDSAARASGFGTESRFNTVFPAMFKSGTASEYSSLWCLGATAEYTVGAWAGNFDGRPAFGSTGSSLAAAIVVETLEELSFDKDGRLRSRPGQRPPGLAAVRICSQSGFPASTRCPATRLEFFAAGSKPREICPVHEKQMTVDQLLIEEIIGDQKAPRILFPRDGSVFYRDRAAGAEDQSIQGWIAAFPDDELRLVLDGRSLIPQDPFRPQLPVRPGRHWLKVEGRHGEDEVQYTVH